MSAMLPPTCILFTRLAITQHVCTSSRRFSLKEKKVKHGFVAPRRNKKNSKKKKRKKSEARRIQWRSHRRSIVFSFRVEKLFSECSFNFDVVNPASSEKKKKKRECFQMRETRKKRDTNCYLFSPLFKRKKKEKKITLRNHARWSE